jgi:hypothetical protein
MVPQMECAQISVSGGTGGSTPATVSIPGAYSVRQLSLSLLVVLGTDTQNRRLTPASRSTSTMIRANPTPRPTISFQVSDTHYRVSQIDALPILTSLSRSRALHMRRWIFFPQATDPLDWRLRVRSRRRRAFSAAAAVLDWRHRVCGRNNLRQRYGPCRHIGGTRCSFC